MVDQWPKDQPAMKPFPVPTKVGTGAQDRRERVDEFIQKCIKEWCIQFRHRIGDIELGFMFLHQKHSRCSNLCFSNVHGPGVLVENVKPQSLVQKQNDVKFVPENDREDTFIFFFSFLTHPCGPEGPQELNGCAQRGPGVDNW